MKSLACTLMAIVLLAPLFLNAAELPTQRPEIRSALFPGILASDGSMEGTIFLQWPRIDGVDTYQVFRSTTPSELGTLIYETTGGVTHLDLEVIPGVLYYYQLVICSVSMCIYYESYDSGYAAAVTIPAPPPSYLSATDGTYTDRVELAWEYVSGALYYKLYRSSSADQVGGLIYQSTYETQTAYTDQTVTPGVTHYYRIQSCISNQCSGYGSIETGYAYTAPAPPPSNLDATDGTYTDRVYLTWKAVPGALYYRLYRSASQNLVGGLIYQSADNTQTSYMDTSVTPGVTHYYRIQSCIYGQCSGYGTIESGYAAKSVIQTVGETLAAATWTVEGYFIHYGSGAFDWLYLTPDGSLAAKLEGMDETSGNLKWNIVQGGGAASFSSISTFTIQLDTRVSTTVLFGSYLANDAALNGLGAVLGNQTVGIDGYFIHYGQDVYDWVYVSQDTSLVAKLDGMDPATNLLNWSILQYGTAPLFESVSITPDGKAITFGAVK